MTNETALLLRSVSPADANAVFSVGAKAVKTGLEAEALPLLEAAVARHPAVARMWQVLGLAHRRLDDLAPAVAAFEKAAALAPADPLIAHSLARTAMEAGLPSVELYRRALALAPNDASMLLGQAAAQLAEGRVDDAIADLEAMLRRHPGWLEGHGTLCRLRWLRGERDGFASSYAQAAAVMPGDAAVWRAWVDSLMSADMFDEVLALLARARAAMGSQPALDAAEAVAAAEMGATDAAERLFAALGPILHVTMAVRYARHLLRAGRPEAAAAFIEPWLEDSQADLVWPYAAAAWRLVGDSRWQWLEGDERFVGIYDLSDAVPLQALAERLRGIHQALGQPLDQSVRGGTQTDGPLLSRIEPEIRALRAAIVAAVERHIAQLPPPDPRHPTRAHRRDGPVRFAGSWSVRLLSAGHHSNHIHPQGWLSSAFYVALPDSLGVGDQGWLTLGQPQAELGLVLAPFRKIEPKPGRLVLFPSTMWHGTIPFDAGERMTVAFDVARPQQA